MQRHVVYTIISSLLARSPLPLSISLPSNSSHTSLERFLCLRVLTLLRSLRCSSTSIIHQAGEGTTRLGLRLRQLSTCLHQLSTCLPPGVAPGAESVTDRYIHTLAQIRSAINRYLCCNKERQTTRLGTTGHPFSSSLKLKYFHTGPLSL